LLASVPELSEALNFRNVPELPADALSGRGVFDTLRSLGVIVLKRLGAAAPTPKSSPVQATVERPQLQQAPIESHEHAGAGAHA
jgi:mutual gliding-motility protein MglA